MESYIFATITVPLEWRLLSKLQKNFIIFSSIEKYIIGKFVL
jgi:hypothetical protein